MTGLPPTDELILEVLVARYRLGETLWPFDNRLSLAADRLVALGRVERMHGIVGGSFRLRLAEAEVAKLSAAYVAPVFADIAARKLAAGLRMLADRVDSGEIEVGP